MTHPSDAPAAPSPDLARFLEEARQREKSQTLFYRALASRADEAGEAALAERFNELHADEQHHLSRLSARAMEVGAPSALPEVAAPEPVSVEGWEEVAREREAEEVRWYEQALEGPWDVETTRLVEEILQSERMHLEHLGGKWMSA